MLIHTPEFSRSQGALTSERSPGSLHQEPGYRRRCLRVATCWSTADVDAHWSLQNQILTLLASDDNGATWYKHREIDQADLTAGDERLVTPRLSLLE